MSRIEMKCRNKATNTTKEVVISETKFKLTNQTTEEEL